MYRGVYAAAIACLAIVLIAGGCGGSSNSSSNGSTTSAAATVLTKPEFVKQANAICKQGGDQIHREVQLFIKQQNLSTKAALATAQQEEFVTKFVVPSLRTQAEGLAKLAIPQGDAAEITAIVKGLEKLAKTSEEEPGSSLQEGDGNPLAEVNKAAKAYGVKECEQP